MLYQLEDQNTRYVNANVCKLSDESHICMKILYSLDIDECAQIGTCAQKCINTPGEYICECYPGYHLSMGK